MSIFIDFSEIRGNFRLLNDPSLAMNPPQNNDMFISSKTADASLSIELSFAFVGCRLFSNNQNSAAGDVTMDAVDLTSEFALNRVGVAYTGVSFPLTRGLVLYVQSKKAMFMNIQHDCSYVEYVYT